ncbi:MAG: hypothetical protein U1E17_00935 [Geminicoccaceae bacterium]
MTERRNLLRSGLVLPAALAMPVAAASAQEAAPGQSVIETIKRRGSLMVESSPPSCPGRCAPRTAP